MPFVLQAERNEDMGNRALTIQDRARFNHRRHQPSLSRQRDEGRPLRPSVAGASHEPVPEASVCAGPMDNGERASYHLALRQAIGGLECCGHERDLEGIGGDDRLHTAVFLRSLVQRHCQASCRDKLRHLEHAADGALHRPRHPRLGAHIV